MVRTDDQTLLDELAVHKQLAHSTQLCIIRVQETKITSNTGDIQTRKPVRTDRVGKLVEHILQNYRQTYRTTDIHTELQTDIQNYRQSELIQTNTSWLRIYNTLRIIKRYWSPASSSTKHGYAQ